MGGSQDLPCAVLSYDTPLPGGPAPSPSLCAGSCSWKRPSSPRSHLHSCLRPLTFIEPLPAAEGFNSTNLSPAPACVYAFPSQASAMAPVRGLEAKLRLCSGPEAALLGRAHLLLPRCWQSPAPRCPLILPGSLPAFSAAWIPPSWVEEPQGCQILQSSGYFLKPQLLKQGEQRLTGFPVALVSLRSARSSCLCRTSRAQEPTGHRSPQPRRGAAGRHATTRGCTQGRAER